MTRFVPWLGWSPVPMFKGVGKEWLPRMPMWSWAILRKPLNHWSRGSFSDRLECHGSGWIPDLTRCEAIQGFRILSAASEFPADCSSSAGVRSSSTPGKPRF